MGIKNRRGFQKFELLVYNQLVQSKAEAETDDRLGASPILNDFDCEYGQGYLFSNPLAADEMTPRLREGFNFIP